VWERASPEGGACLLWVGGAENSAPIQRAEAENPARFLQFRFCPEPDQGQT